MKILFLDSAPNSHHERFKKLISSLGEVHSAYSNSSLEDFNPSTFGLVVFADLDLTVNDALKFDAPRVGISWAWDLQMSKRQGADVKKKLQKALTSSELVLVDNPSLLKEFDVLGEHPKETLCLPYGIELVQYPFREQVYETSNTPLLYSNRQWEDLYRVDLLLEAAEELDKRGYDFNLVLANDGSLRQSLMEKFRKLFDSGVCEWIGRVSSDENAKRLEKSDLYISVAKSDGSSLSLLESMAIGIPVLVTDNSSNREWITDGESGYLFAGDSIFSLADKVTQVSSLGSKEIITKARKIVDTKANWDINSSVIIRFIEEALKQHRFQK
jgi:glycosyltransferase involved in cell wall biosynthesis